MSKTNIGEHTQKTKKGDNMANLLEQYFALILLKEKLREQMRAQLSKGGRR